MSAYRTSDALDFGQLTVNQRADVAFYCYNLIIITMLLLGNQTRKQAFHKLLQTAVSYMYIYVCVYIHIQIYTHTCCHRRIQTKGGNTMTRVKQIWETGTQFSLKQQCLILYCSKVRGHHFVFSMKTHTFIIYSLNRKNSQGIDKVRNNDCYLK